MCRLFAGTFAGHHICLGSPIVVDSSSVLIFDSFVFTYASAGAERQVCLFECAAYSLDFASNIRSPTKLFTKVVTWRNGGANYKTDVHCCRLCILQ